MPLLTCVGGLGEEVVRSESMPLIDPLPPLPRNERGKTAAPGRVKRDKPQVVHLIVPRSCQPADGDEGPSRSKTLSAIRAQAHSVKPECIRQGGRELFVKVLAQQAASPMQPGLHRCLEHAEEIGGFLNTQFF